MIRKGLLLGNKQFFFSQEKVIHSVSESFTTFIMQFYLDQEVAPTQKVLLPKELKKYTNQLTKAVQLSFSKAKQDALIKFQVINEKYEDLYLASLKEAKGHQRKRLKEHQDFSQAQNQLQKILSTEALIRTIECYDVAIWQGSSPTAAKVVSKDGRPQKSSYRYYHLQQRPEGNNDFAMLEEALERRLKRKLLPDLFLIDGGAAQLSVCKRVLEKNELNIPVLALAKKKNQKEERLFLPGKRDSIPLLKYPQLYRVLTSLRDEAHRFSRKLHHKQEQKRIFAKK